MDNDSKLTVIDETGTPQTIYVLDIISPEETPSGKEIMLYFFVDKPVEVYASYIIEDETSYELAAITDPRELDFVNSEIDRVVEEWNTENG